METLRLVDHSALKVNQALLILIHILAFVFNLPWLALINGLVLLAGFILAAPGYLPVYRWAVLPLRLMRPDKLQDNPEPHRFSQLLGALFSLGGSAALFAGIGALGWGLVWLVVGLAALNLFGGFCVGCAVYYWLNRLGVPGFRVAPPSGVFPGMRPKAPSAG